MYSQRIEVSPGVWKKPSEMPRKESKTGRRRYQRFRHPFQPQALMLEVEVSVFDYHKRRWFCEWRLATPADVSEKELA